MRARAARSPPPGRALLLVGAALVLLAPAPGVQANPGLLACDRNITAGGANQIMGVAVQESTAGSVRLRRGGVPIECGETLIAGDADLDFDLTGLADTDEFLIEAVASVGTGAWGMQNAGSAASCAGERVVDSVSVIYAVPTSGTVTLRVVWANDHGGPVYVSPDCEYAVSSAPCGLDFAGPNCSACAQDQYSVDCNERCNMFTSCNGHGRCRGKDGGCLCDPGWEGPECSDGSDCGIGFGGPDCAVCSDDVFGTNCSLACDAEIHCSGNGRCRGLDASCICNSGAFPSALLLSVLADAASQTLNCSCCCFRKMTICVRKPQVGADLGVMSWSPTVRTGSEGQVAKYARKTRTLGLAQCLVMRTSRAVGMEGMLSG
jgi:hypothetical protein